MFENAHRIVIKLGSALLTDTVSGELNAAWLQQLIADVAALQQQGKQVILVSSGAVSLGRKRLGIEAGATLTLEEKQAAAACGQPILMDAFEDALATHHIHTAQLLLMLADSEDRRRYMNASHVLRRLLKHQIVPVINENDTLSTEELRVGDNDRLAARVAQMAAADMLILLTDVDGLYSANPNQSDTAEHIAEVKNIDDRITAMAGDSDTAMGTGGMVTKLEAARIATACGCTTLITKGDVDHPIQALQEGARHTVFTAQTSPYNARKQWIAGSLDTQQGAITLDEGAIHAIQSGNSLLPVGVTSVSGEFQRGDTIRVLDQQGSQIGCGLSAFSHHETGMILGKKQHEIETILNYSGRTELIHRDDLVLD